MCCNCNNTRIVQIGGGIPFTFSVTAGNSPYNGGLGVITGPIVINNNDIIHFYSVNTINFQVTPGSANTFAEVRIDPNPLNTITVSAAGLLSLGGGGGVNIYNSDGTITDPNRIVTIGASTLNFNADNAGFLSNTAITTNQFRIDYSDPAGYAGSFSDNSTYNEMANGNAALDEVARIFTQDSAGNDPSAGIQVVSGPLGITGIDVNSGSNLGNYINLYNNFGTYFELRLDGDPGVAGYTIISQGPGASPIWGPGGGGGGSFGLNADLGAAETVIVGVDNLSILGANLISTTVSASDTVTVSMIPGANGQIAYTIAGTPTWAFPQDILDIINFTTNVNWNFNSNEWTVTNVDTWDVTANDINFKSNTFDVSSPVVCFTGITQNNALTRILAQDAGGCLAWRDVSTISPLTVQDEGVTIGTSGGITQMNFVGAGVTVGGGGSNTTITIPGAAASQNLFDANDTLAANRTHAGAGFDFVWRGFGQHITNATLGGTSATINLEPDGFIDGVNISATNGPNSSTTLTQANVNGSNIEITAVGVTGTGKSRTSVDDLNQNIESFILADVAPPGGNVNMVRAHYTSSFLAGERNRIDIMSTDGYYTLGNGGDVTTHPPLNNTINNVLVHQTISGRVFIRDQATITSALATKEEVIPTVMGLKDIAKMRVVDYKRKEDGIAMTGMIAEELHALDPKYSYDGESMVFPSVIGTLVKAVQELEAKIKILENR